MAALAESLKIDDSRYQQLLEALEAAKKVSRKAPSLGRSSTTSREQVEVFLQQCDDDIRNFAWSSLNERCEALQTQPINNFPEFHALLAVSRTTTGQTEDAVATAMEAIQKYPEESLSYLTIAIIAISRRLPSSAKCWLQLASNGIHRRDVLLSHVQENLNSMTTRVVSLTRYLITGLPKDEISFERACVALASPTAEFNGQELHKTLKAIRQDPSGDSWLSIWGDHASELLGYVSGYDSGSLALAIDSATYTEPEIPESAPASSQSGLSAFERILTFSTVLPILQRLSLNDIGMVMKCSKRTLSLVSQPDTWRMLCERAWNPIPYHLLRYAPDTPAAVRLKDIPLSGSYPVHQHLVAKIFNKSVPPTDQFLSLDLDPWIYKRSLMNIQLLKDLCIGTDRMRHEDTRQSGPAVIEDWLKMLEKVLDNHRRIMVRMNTSNVHTVLIQTVTQLLADDSTSNTAKYLVEYYLDSIMHFSTKTIQLFYSNSALPWCNFVVNLYVEMLSSLLVLGGCGRIKGLRSTMRTNSLTAFSEHSALKGSLQPLVFQIYNASGLVSLLRNIRPLTETTSSLINAIMFWIGSEHWQSLRIISQAPFFLLKPIVDGIAQKGLTLSSAGVKTLASDASSDTISTPSTTLPVTSDDSSQPQEIGAEGGSSKGEKQADVTQDLSSHRLRLRWHMIQTHTVTLLNFSADPRVDTTIFEVLEVDQDGRVQGRGYSSYGTTCAPQDSFAPGDSTPSTNAANAASAVERSFTVLDDHTFFIDPNHTTTMRFVIKFDDNGEELVFQAQVMPDMIAGSFGKRVSAQDAADSATYVTGRIFGPAAQYYIDPRDNWYRAESNVKPELASGMVTGFNRNAMAPSIPPARFIPFKREGSFIVVAEPVGPFCPETNPREASDTASRLEKLEQKKKKEKEEKERPSGGQTEEKSAEHEEKKDAEEDSKKKKKEDEDNYPLWAGSPSSTLVDDALPMTPPSDRPKALSYMSYMPKWAQLKIESGTESKAHFMFSMSSAQFQFASLTPTLRALELFALPERAVKDFGQLMVDWSKKYILVQRGQFETDEHYERRRMSCAVQYVLLFLTRINFAVHTGLGLEHLPTDEEALLAATGRNRACPLISWQSYKYLWEMDSVAPDLRADPSQHLADLATAAAQAVRARWNFILNTSPFEFYGQSERPDELRIALILIAAQTQQRERISPADIVLCMDLTYEQRTELFNTADSMTAAQDAAAAAEANNTGSNGAATDATTDAVFGGRLNRKRRGKHNADPPSTLTLVALGAGLGLSLVAVAGAVSWFFLRKPSLPSAEPKASSSSSNQ